MTIALEEETLTEQAPSPQPRPIASVGLDLSLTASGVARVSQLGAARIPVLGLVGDKGLTNRSVTEQISALDSLEEHIFGRAFPSGARPDVVVIEALDNAQSYGGTTERTVLWWQVVKRLRWHGIPIWMPTSAQVKIYATGNGNASKGQVVDAVTRLWPDWEHRGNDNLADAAAMAELGLALIGQPSVELPKQHTRVLPMIRSVGDPPSRVTKKASRQ